MRNGLERIDVQAAIGLIQNGIFRLEHRQLQDFRALFFAPGKTFVDRTRRERTIHPEQLHLFVKLRVVIGRFELFTVRQTRLYGRTEKISNRYAGNFAWILESQEKPAPGTFIGVELEKIFAIHQDFTLSDLVVRMTSQHLGERALP